MDAPVLEPGARRAVEHLLQAARRHLGMEAAFLAELTESEQLYRAATDGTAGFAILEGGTLPRLESYCQHVIARGGPWVVRDTTSDEVASGLEITERGRFGAYIGVPVRLLDGSVYGTLCCIAHEPRPDLGERDVAVLEALADVLGFHVSQLQAAGREAELLREVGGELAGRLRQQELRAGLLAEVIRSGRTPTVVLDPEDLRIDYCNDAAADLMGVPAEDVPGTYLWERAGRCSEHDVRERLTPLTTGTTSVVSVELDDVTPAGRVLDVIAQLVTTDDGTTAVLVTAHDVTERRRSLERLARALELERAAAEQLRSVDAMRNAFLTAVSHELRTPLTTVRLTAETLRDGRAAADLVPNLLERMMVNADRLDRLLADLLDLNQFTHGELRLVRERVALDQLVRDAVEQVELTSHRVELQLQPIVAEVAPTKFERIVVNLVLNASVHTSGGTITVRLVRSDGAAVLSVEDEGDGVAPAEREALFEPFRQGTTVPGHRPGTGVGLALVAAFAELHGGRAWVEDAPTGGAAFRVALPLDA